MRERPGAAGTSLPGVVVRRIQGNGGSITIPAGLKAIAIGSGEMHSLAVRPDGTVVAWGDNGDGKATVPANLTGVIAVAGGRYHSLALKSNGGLVAWGRNNAGQCTIPAGVTDVKSAPLLHPSTASRVGDISPASSEILTKSCLLNGRTLPSGQRRAYSFQTTITIDSRLHLMND